MTTRVRVSGFENPKVPDRDWSEIATRASKSWDGTDRPEGWKNSLYGGVTHTSGRGLPSKAADRGMSPLDLAVRYYTGSHGCNYICGYGGIAAGELLQIASDFEQAKGVGIDPKKPETNQWISVTRRDWKSELPPDLLARWRSRWPGYANPLDLLPGTKRANSCYVHLECIPLTDHWMKEFGVEPHAPGMLFTSAQHESVATWYLDLAKRHRWGGEWWRTPRVLGHEDLTPLSRHTKAGGWDPGWLREKPYFDWDFVITRICEELKVPVTLDKLPKDREGGHYARFT